MGTLAESDQVLLKSGLQRLDQFAEHLKQEHLVALQCGGPPTFKPIAIHCKVEKEHHYSSCATHRIAKFSWQRLVIDHSQANLSDSPVFYNL